MNHNICAEFKHVRLRPLRESDLEHLREWRNNKEISKFLRNIGEIKPEMQLNWYKKECEDATSATFAIEEIDELNRLVGSVAIYDINGDSAEVGKIVVGDPEAKGKKIGYYALIIAMYIGCNKFGIENYFLEVHEDNMPAKTNYLRTGFVVTGKHEYATGGYELEMMLAKKHFYELHDFLDGIKIY